MNHKKIKNDYRHEHTDVIEHTVGVGKNTRIIKSRERRSGSPSLKQYAKRHSDGEAWLQRKAEQKNKHVRTVHIWQDDEPRRRGRR